MADVNLLNMEALKEPEIKEQERINTQNIPPKSIKQRNLGDNSVGADQLQIDSVGAEQIQDDAVGTAQLIEPITLTSPTLTTPIITTPTIQTWDSWQLVSDTWTYASASTINVPSGAASLYRVGDKLKLTNTTLKYFIITAVADTLLTIAVNTDYVVANAAISAIYLSHAQTPIGFPEWFACTTTHTGFSANPTFTMRYCVQGRTVTLKYDSTGAGTSNATGYTVTAPIASAASGNLYGISYGVDNGAETSVTVKLLVSSSTVVLCKGITATATSWTNTGNKYAYFTIVYEI